jgi:hypothetical protein
MKRVFRVSDLGQDGMDRTVLGYVADDQLAKRLAAGRGAMGHGDGAIESVDVWYNFNELPETLQTRIRQTEERSSQQVSRLADELTDRLGSLPPDQQDEVIERILSQRSD